MGVDYRQQYEPDQLESFFPNEIVKMLIVVLCTLAVLILLVVLPTLLESFGVAGMFHEEQPADPRTTPAHIRPEWYFLAVYQYLKLMPQEMFGMDGKTLGMFTQAIAMAMVVLLPFWAPTKPAGLRRNEWPKGLVTFAVFLVLTVVPVAVFGRIAQALPEDYRDILNPMFVWPVVAVVAYLVAGRLAKRVALPDAFKWLKLLTIVALLIALQFFAFIVVLGQGLSWGLTPALGYALGAVPCVIAAAAIVRWAIRRIRGTDQHLCMKVILGFITEGMLLFIGLTIWAMWPAGGLRTDHGWHHEARSFAFFLLIIAAAMVVFFSLIVTERRTIRRTLGPPPEEGNDVT